MKNVMSLLAFALVMCFANSSYAQSIHGIFRVVKGEVTVTSKGGAVSKAKLGQKIFPSDKVKAGKDSRAKIVMVDKNEINISPETEIVIEDYQYKPEENKKNVLINVLYGKVRAKVEQKYDSGSNKFQIKTPTAVAGVRGTDFITGYKPSTRTSEVVTFEGRVEFGLPGRNGAIMNPVMVAVGQTTTLVGSAPPSAPVEVPKTELQDMDSSSDAEKTPAASAEPKSEPKAEEKKEEKKSDAKAGGPAGSPGGRQTASTGGGGPIMTVLGDTIGKGDGPQPQPITPTFEPPRIPEVTKPPVTVCTACEAAIDLKNRTLQIKVTHGNGP